MLTKYLTSSRTVFTVGGFFCLIMVLNGLTIEPYSLKGMVCLCIDNN